MKILFLGDARSPHIVRWVSYYAQKGHEVHLATTYPEAWVEAPEKVFVHDILPRVKLPKLNFLGMVSKMHPLLRTVQPELLHAHYVNPYGWCGSLSNFHPFIVTVWGGDILSEQGAFKRRGARTLTKWALRKADLVTADSSNLIEACVSFGKNRKSIHRIAFGIDIDFFSHKLDTGPLKRELNVPEDVFVIFSPRRVDRLMNVDIIIKSIPKVIQALPKTIFLFKIFPGQVDERYLKEIQRLSEDLAVASHIRYCDDPGYGSMRACYQMADIVVSVPSSDGLPATIFEAMASGASLIVSDLPAYRGIVMDGETGVCVPDQDVDRLAAAIIDSLRDVGKRSLFVKRGRQIVKEKGDFTLEMDRMEALYMDLIRVNKPRSEKR